MDENICRNGNGILLHDNGLELVEWTCKECGHVWYEFPDADQYPNCCPECGIERYLKT